MVTEFPCALPRFLSPSLAPTHAERRPWYRSPNAGVIDMVARQRQTRSDWSYLLGVSGFVVLANLGYGAAAQSRLGVSAGAAALLLLVEVCCRHVNLRLCELRGGSARLAQLPEVVQRTLLRLRSPFSEQTGVALNVGGGVIPIAFATYALSRDPISLPTLLMVSFVVAAAMEVLRRSSTTEKLAIPLVLVAPAVALILGCFIAPEHRATLVHVGGLAGILAGCDLLHIRDVRNIGIAEISIGAAHTFDAIFVNQLFSLLLN